MHSDFIAAQGPRRRTASEGPRATATLDAPVTILTEHTNTTRFSNCHWRKNDRFCGSRSETERSRRLHHLSSLNFIFIFDICRSVSGFSFFLNLLGLPHPTWRWLRQAVSRRRVPWACGSHPTHCTVPLQVLLGFLAVRVVVLFPRRVRTSALQDIPEGRALLVTERFGGRFVLVIEA